MVGTSVNRASHRQGAGSIEQILRSALASSDDAALYRLGDADLAFGELLPEAPGSVAQQEYEERTAVGFQRERLTKRLAELGAYSDLIASTGDSRAARPAGSSVDSIAHSNSTATAITT